jgi:hypothetical protein
MQRADCKESAACNKLRLHAFYHPGIPLDKQRRMNAW